MNIDSSRRANFVGIETNLLDKPNKKRKINPNGRNHYVKIFKVFFFCFFFLKTLMSSYFTIDSAPKSGDLNPNSVPLIKKQNSNLKFSEHKTDNPKTIQKQMATEKQLKDIKVM